MKKEEEIKYRDDVFLEKIFATVIINNKEYGICKSYAVETTFVCPHCKTKDDNKIKEMRIDGEPRIKSLAYGYGWADTVYGKSYLPCIDGTRSRDYPVSVKYYCENCHNEFTKPDLMRLQRDMEKQREKMRREAILFCRNKLQGLFSTN